MKVNSRVLSLSAAWSLTLLVGFFVGRGSGGTDQESTSGDQDRDRRPDRSAGTGIDTGRGTRGNPGGKSVTRGRPDAPRTTEAAVASLHQTLALGDPTERTRRLLDLLDQLSPEDFGPMAEALRGSDLARIRGEEYELLLGAWVKVDPFAAVDYLGEKDSSGSARRAALRAWAAIDPRAAIAWMQDKEDVGRQNDWYVGAISGIATHDPAEALVLLQSLPDGHTRSSTMQAVIPHVLSNGFDYATDWVAGIDDEKLMSQTARGLADDLTRMDPERAGQWVSDLTSVSARRDSSEEVSDQWARRDLEAARRWVETLPADTITEGAEGIVRHMARQDPQRAVEWINTLGISPGQNSDFDGARRVLLYELVGSDPQLALENVATLAADHERNYSGLLSRWSRNDRDAARAWVEYNADVLPERIVRTYVRGGDRR